MVHILFLSIFLTLLSSPATSNIPSLTICYEGQVTGNSVQLNMDTSAFAGTTGSCQCRILFHMKSAFNMSSQHITSPNCGTDIVLSDTSFKHTCTNCSIPQIYYTKNFTYTEQIALRVKANGESDLPMSGILQMKTYSNTNFTLECYETKVRRMTTSPIDISIISTTSLTTSISTTTSRISTSRKIQSNSQMATTRPIPSSIVSKDSTTKGTHITTESDVTPEGVPNNNFPVALAAGCAAGGLVLVGLLVFATVIYRYRCICIRRSKESPTITESRENPTYCDLANRENTEYLSIRPPESGVHPTYCDLTNRENTEYEHIGHRGENNVYKNDVVE